MGLLHHCYGQCAHDGGVGRCVSTSSHCPWWAPTGCSPAATSAPRTRRNSSSPEVGRPVPRSCARRSSSSSSAASPSRSTDGDTVRISPALQSNRWRPMTSRTAVARTAVGRPVGGILEVAGPDRYPLDDLVRARLRASNDTRRVVTDPQSRYFGVRTRRPHPGARPRRDGVPHALRGLAPRQRARPGPTSTAGATHSTEIDPP